MCAVASVSWGGRRPSLAGYVMVTGGRAGATAAGGCECWRSSGREESRQCLLRCGLVVHDAFSHLRNSNTRRQNDGQGQRDVPQYPRGSIRPRVLPGQAYAARKEEDGRQLQVLHGGKDLRGELQVRRPPTSACATSSVSRSRRFRPVSARTRRRSWRTFRTTLICRP